MPSAASSETSWAWLETGPGLEQLGDPVLTLVLGHPHRVAPRARRTASSARPRRSRAPSISSSVTSSGGASRTASGRTGLTSRPAARAATRTAAASLVLEHGGQQQSWPAYVRARPGAAPSPASERAPRPGRPGPGRPRLHHREGRPHRRHGQRLAPEGGAVVARAEGGGHLGPGPARAHRHAVAQGLGHGDHVGRETLGWKANHHPVRPNPVWTSSTMSRASPSVQSWRAPTR